MRKLLCILATFCLTLCGLGSCSYEGSWFYTVRAAVVCEYESGDSQKSEKLYDFYKDQVSDRQMEWMLEELTGNVDEGYTGGTLTMDWYDAYGDWKRQDIYEIDKDNQWER